MKLKLPPYEFDPWPDGSMGDVIYVQFTEKFHVLIHNGERWMFASEARGDAPDPLRVLGNIQYSDREPVLTWL